MYVILDHFNLKESGAGGTQAAQELRSQLLGQDHHVGGVRNARQHHARRKALPLPSRVRRHPAARHRRFEASTTSTTRSITRDSTTGSSRAGSPFPAGEGSRVLQKFQRPSQADAPRADSREQKRGGDAHQDNPRAAQAPEVPARH
eukprot:scaffold1172_cov247-Pinguiococcus_pyrenoidosus.AAC.1